MEIIIDNIAIWKADFHKGYTVRTIPMNTTYKDKNGLYNKNDKPMYRYAKNYKAGKTEFVLFVRTYEKDMAKVEKQLDKVAKKITEEKAKAVVALATIDNFQYLDEFLKGEE